MLRYIRGILVGALAMLAVGAVALFMHWHGAGFPLLEPAGPIGMQERSVIFAVMLLSAIIVVPVFFLLFYFAWRYRDDHPQASVHHRPDWDHMNLWIEFSWWTAPTIIIAVLSVIAWQSAHALDPYKPIAPRATRPNGTLTVQVVALDWKWLFIYPAQGIASVNLLEIPEGIPVHFYLTADDAPMNSFWIPQLGGQIMVMPGMTTQLNLEASRTGTFNGFSANISGKGFAGMAFKAKAVPLQEFNAWIIGTQASSSPLTVAAYQQLARPSEYNAPATYAPVDASLYTATVDKYMMPSGSLSFYMPRAPLPRMQ